MFRFLRATCGPAGTFLRVLFAPQPGRKQHHRHGYQAGWPAPGNSTRRR